MTMLEDEVTAHAVTTFGPGGEMERFLHVYAGHLGGFKLKVDGYCADDAWHRFLDALKFVEGEPEPKPEVELAPEDNPDCDEFWTDEAWGITGD